MANRTSSNAGATEQATAATLKERFIEQTQERLEALRPQVQEFEELNDLLTSLTGQAAKTGRSTSSRSTSGSTGSTGSTRSSSRVGGRMEQFLELVRANPGITIPQAAVSMDIQANYLYRVRDKAKAEGKIDIEGMQIYPAGYDHSQADTSKREAELAGASAS